MSTINYIITAYYGPRRNSSIDTASAVLQHCEMVKNIDSVSQVTLAVNIDTVVPDQLETAVPYLSDLLSDNGKVLRVMTRENRGYSYGSWEQAVIANLGRFDYHFLIEDDYIPAHERFYIPFIKKFTETTAYVCSKVAPIGKEVFATISNGMLSDQVAQKVNAKHGRLFTLHDAGTIYVEGEWNQIHFLDKFKNLGYDIEDVSDITSVPFYEYGGRIIEAGVPDLQPAIIPILQ